MGFRKRRHPRIEIGSSHLPGYTPEDNTIQIGFNLLPHEREIIIIRMMCKKDVCEDAPTSVKVSELTDEDTFAIFLHEMTHWAQFLFLNEEQRKMVLDNYEISPDQIIEKMAEEMMHGFGG